MIRAINAVTQLEEGESNEADEIRKITITEDTDGTITAESIKLYNLLKVSFHDLSGFLLKGVPIPFVEDTKVKIVLALINLVHEFYPKLAHTFNDQDVRILLVILELGNREFTFEKIGSAYRDRFQEELEEDRLTLSRNALEQLKVLRYKGGGKYIAREKMTYERSW